MSERISNERLAAHQAWIDMVSVGGDTDHIRKELIEALLAERAEVTRLETERDCDERVAVVECAYNDLLDNCAKLRQTLEAVLLFYSIDWPEEKRKQWKELTGKNEATTKALCDTIRQVISHCG